MKNEIKLVKHGNYARLYACGNDCDSDKSAGVRAVNSIAKQTAPATCKLRPGDFSLWRPGTAGASASLVV